MELLVQPADGSVLPARDRWALPILGLRLAAGFGRSRGPEPHDDARRHRDHAAPLDHAGRRERRDRSRPEGPRRRLRRQGRTPRPQHGPDAAPRPAARVRRALSLRVDAASRLLAARSAPPLLRLPAGLRDDEPRRDVERDQRRPDAREPRRAAEPRRADGRGRERRGPAPRNRLCDRALSHGGPRPLGRDRRRPGLAHEGRGRALGERHAEGADALVEGDDARGVALRRGNGVRSRRPPPARRLRALSLPHEGRRKDVDALCAGHPARQLPQRDP